MTIVTANIVPHQEFRKNSILDLTLFIFLYDLCKSKSRSKLLTCEKLKYAIH